MPPSTLSAFAFLSDGGETGALMRAHDWSQSPLGAPDCWPQSLRTVVGVMLNSKFPMFIAWGSELGFLYNDAYAEILGAKHPAALGRRFQDIWAEIWDDIHPIILQALQGTGTYHQNLPLTMNRYGHDEHTWFTFSYSPVRDESGQVSGMFCAVTETTEQVLAERHRAEEHEHLRQLFQQAPGIIAVLRGPTHIYEIANDAYLQLVGHRNVIGKPIREALPELTGQGFYELFDQVYKTGVPFVGKEMVAKLQRSPDGPLEERFVNFVLQPIRDPRDNVSGIFVEGSDITDAVKAHQAVRDSEQRLRQLANTIPQLVWMATPDGRVQWYSNRWSEYTGLPMEQLLHDGWQGLVHPDDLQSVTIKWQQAQSTGEDYEATVRLRSREGDFHTFVVHAAPLRDRQGRIEQWFGANTDITPIEAVQQELRQANRRKDEFLAMLAHELRNPLAPIATATEVLKLTNVNPERVRQTSSIIARQVEHMTALVDDLLDVSRVTRGLVKLQQEILSVNNLVADAIEQVESLIEIKHHRLTVHVPNESFFVRGDRTRLIQVFSNLLNNAAKYTPAEGHITLQLSGSDTQLQIAVEDNGIGIAPSLLPHIFDLFTQGEQSPDRTQGGLGLGLSLVKSLVELQGGSVSAYSDGLGRGSRFVVSLPRVPTDSAISSSEAKHNDIPRTDNQTRLMVVDDNRDAAQTLSLLLDTTGHQVSIAYDAEEALKTALQTSPEIVFMDIGLPGMDGYELARRLRQLPETAQSLLVAVTGYGQPEDKERAMQAGFDHHMVKPVKLGAVLALLATLEK